MALRIRFDAEAKAREILQNVEDEAKVIRASMAADRRQLQADILEVQDKLAAAESSGTKLVLPDRGKSLGRGKPPGTGKTAKNLKRAANREKKKAKEASVIQPQAA